MEAVSIVFVTHYWLLGRAEDQGYRAWNQTTGAGPWDGWVPAQSASHLHTGHGCASQSISLLLLPSTDPQQAGEQLSAQTANQSWDTQTQPEVPVMRYQKGTWCHCFDLYAKKCFYRRSHFWVTYRVYKLWTSRPFFFPVKLEFPRVQDENQVCRQYYWISRVCIA